MERDRQGSDPRFVNHDNSTPPSLDVYQFIWDRTRMIRKDFILQNYIAGPNGKCNAIATRCHERIARWHCMVEHQLSHIDEFKIMQSQQNITELGQTMKTLNLYYDDADGRCTKEDDDDVNDSNNGFGSGSGNGSVDHGKHGCGSDIIMGKDPIDYNGQTLRNSYSSSSSSMSKRRVIGDDSSNSCISNGTAEPEMRGLYILLTINLDGGMEVLKFSARLSELRPEIFNSVPVQLALKVYKATRENNYAKFFSLLRSKTTPYLYACIMFNYVEQMRKVAFVIMSKTFGIKGRDTGEGINDQYPLQDLVHLLCFEDSDEAREACQHYNITVKQVEDVDCIFWRQTDFIEAKDPVKGNVIRLHPRKMNRVIERKLDGATRLAVCRGEVSGVGATIDKASSSPRRSLEKDLSSKLLERNESRRRKLEEERIKRENQLAEQRRIIEEQTLLNEAREKKERKEQERRILLENQKRREQEAREREEERQKLKQTELARMKREEEMEKQRVIQAKQAALQRKVEEKIWEQQEIARLAEEQQRQALEMERQRQLMEQHKAAERIRKQQEMERKATEEAHRLQEMQKKAEEEARRQKEIERRRLLQQQREAEERRIEMVWKAKINLARKLISIQRWRKLLSSRRDQRIRTINSLESIDPTQAKAFAMTRVARQDVGPTDSTQIDLNVTYEDFFYQIGTNCHSTFKLGKMLSSALTQHNVWDYIDNNKFLNSSATSRNTFLFKMAILIPDTHGVKDQEQLSNTIKLWIDSRLRLNEVHLHKSGIDRQVRFVASLDDDIDSNEALESYDAMMIINPPVSHDLSTQYPSSVENVFRITINLGDIEDADATEFDNVLFEGCTSLFHEYASSISKNEEYETCSNIPTSMFMIEKLSLKKVCTKFLKKALWTMPDDSNSLYQLPSHVQRSLHESTGERIMEHCSSSLTLFLDSISEYSSTLPRDMKEFADMHSNEIPGYFAEGEGLPLNWMEYSKSCILSVVIHEIYPGLKTFSQMDEFLQNLLDKAPLIIRQHCAAMYQNRQYRRCLECALDWYENGDVGETGHFIFLSLGRVNEAIDKVLESNLNHDNLSNNDQADYCIQSKVDSETMTMYDKENITASLITRQETPPKAKSVELKEDDLPSRMSFASSVYAHGNDNSKNKRSLIDSHDTFHRDSTKRLKRERSSLFENDLRRSKDFTANLKAMMEGDTMDMIIGDTKLSSILDDCVNQ